MAEPQQTKKPKRGVSNNDAGAEYHDYDDGDTTNVKVFCVLCPINDDNNASYGISNDGPQIIAAFNESPPNSYACAPLRGGETPWASAALCCITCAASKSSTIYFVCHQCARRVRTALVAAKLFVKICHNTLKYILTRRGPAGDAMTHYGLFPQTSIYYFCFYRISLFGGKCVIVSLLLIFCFFDSKRDRMIEVGAAMCQNCVVHLVTHSVTH